MTMLDRLFTDHPHSRAPGDLFGRFVGRWEIANRLYTPESGQWHESSAEWEFARILDGRGIQDILIGNGDVWGTTVRTWDERAGWRIVWFCPRAAEHCVLRVTDTTTSTIRLEGRQADGRAIRWEFSEVGDRSFTWDGWCSEDDGSTWWHEQHMDASR